MDARKTGKLIARQRKELGLTQKELAQKIYVSDKAVSRWETGKGFPEIAILEVLSEVLGISVEELLQGEKKQVTKAHRAVADSIDLGTHIRPFTMAERAHWNGLAVRRFLARILDMHVYGLLCSFFLYIVCGYIPTYEYDWAVVAAMMFLMLLVEPFLLHKFGTTFGKYLFGIRVLTFNDHRLTVQEGWDRTWKALCYGMALHVPLISLVCLFLSFQKARRNESPGWETGSKLVDEQPFWWKKAAGVLGIVACVLGMACMHIRAYLPRHCGSDISAQELQENYNRYLNYYDITEALELKVVEEGGIITEVTLVIEDGDKYQNEYYDYIINSAVWAYIGAQEEASPDWVRRYLQGNWSMAAVSVYSMDHGFEYAGITASLTAVDKSVKPEQAVHDTITPGEEEKYEVTLIMKKRIDR